MTAGRTSRLRGVTLAAAAVAVLAPGCAPRHVAHPGDHVRAKLDGSRIEGRLVTAGRDSVQVDWMGGSAAFSRGAVEGLSVRRWNSTRWRAVFAVLAVASAAFLVEELASADRHWHADELLGVSARAWLTGFYTYVAIQDSTWVRARLPGTP